MLRLLESRFVPHLDHLRRSKMKVPPWSSPHGQTWKEQAAQEPEGAEDFSEALKQELKSLFGDVSSSSG